MMISDLPQEILIDIFSRLPAKSVGKLKCLSKLWRDLLSSPDFIRSHLNQKIHQQNFLLIDPLYSIHSVSFTKDKIVSRELGLPENWTEVVGSCDGLVLLVNVRDEKFLVNPITLQQVKLPDSPLPVKGSEGFMYGFGYDSSIDDYKIIRLSYYDTDDDYGTDFVYAFVDVYYVKKGLWKRVENSPYLHVDTKPHSGALLNGAIHWLATRRESGFDCVVAAFDLVDEVFAEIAAPGGVILNFCFASFLVVLNSCLCIVDHRSSTQTDVWIMEEYGLAGSWTKFSIVVNDIWDVVKPLCFIGDEEVVLVTGRQTLVVYNLKEGTLRDMIVDGFPEITDGVNFTGSLVSPDFSHIPKEGS